MFLAGCYHAVQPTPKTTAPPATDTGKGGGEVVTEAMLKLTSGNFFFQPSSLSVDAGEITVAVEQNTGSHTFVIDDLGVKQSLRSGQTFAFTADQPGTYEYYCDVPGHRGRGMAGTLTVE